MTVPDLDWQRLRDELAPEGSLRDIFTSATVAIDRWQILWNRLRQTDPGHIFRVGDDATIAPQEIGEVFAIADNSRLVAFRFDFEGLLVDCWFWAGRDVELFIDPKEIVDDDGLESVIGLLRMIGDTIAAPVLLTQENAPTEIILRYDPIKGRFEQPPRDWR